MSQTGKSRSVSATKEGLDKVRQRRAELEKPGKPDKKGWSQEDLAAQAYVHISTVKRFLRGIPVDENSAIAIVQALGLDINEVVDPKDWNPAEQTSDAINWHEVCGKVLAQQREEQRLRRQATERGFELNVYVPLGLVERKQQQRRGGDVPLEEVYQLTEEVITKEYDNDKFLTEVIEPGKSRRIAIIGEPGAGKTTLQEKIAVWIQDNNKGLPICIPLGGLQGKSLEDYLLQIWLKAALRFIEPDASGVEAQAFASLQKLFREGNVWLLLDGVDEMAATSPMEALATIKEQLTDWLVEARIVLTCRLNVWDANVNTILTGFETYRTLQFKPEQVEDFIRQWFACAKEPQRGEELIKKLQETGRERIRELVRNPLRLSLLCQTSYLLPVDEPLPETKAALYERFTRYFYEWKQGQHLDLTQQDELIDELHQALGKLALAGINSAARFRLGRKLARQEMGDRLFNLACRLGWLNLVDREAKTDEAVYAFFHPTFQEYFAACAIKDWHFFLNHVPNNPMQGTYRIFEPQCKEVFLLWLGREDVERESKEQFIQALVRFEKRFRYFQFYECQAYFLAAAGTYEFRDSSFADEIAGVITALGYGYFDSEQQQRWVTFYYDLIKEKARASLEEMECTKAIGSLVELIQNSEDEETILSALYSLEKIGMGELEAINTIVNLIPKFQGKDIVDKAFDSLEIIGNGNPIAVDALVKLIQNFQDERTRSRAASSLGEIGQSNPAAVAALVELIQNSQDEFTHLRAAQSLGKIGKGNPAAIAALVELIQNSQDEFTRLRAAQSLGEIDKSNPIAVGALVKLIQNSQDGEILFSAAWGLDIIDEDNPIAVTALVESLHNYEWESSHHPGLYLKAMGKVNQIYIDALVELIRNSQDELPRSRAAQSLGKIGKGNPEAIAVLVELIQNSQDEFTPIQAAQSLGEIDKSNPIAVAALVKLIQTSQDEFTPIQAVESLGKIGKGNPEAVAALVELIQNSPDGLNCIQAVESLERIDEGNPVATATLVKLIQDSQETVYVRDRAAQSLGKIDKSNPEAVTALVELIQNSQDEYSRRLAADSLGEIGKGNPEAVTALVELIQNSQDELPRSRAVDSLKAILGESQMAEVVTTLKDYLSDQTYKNDFELFNDCYRVLWHCAQNLSYPDFYQAWHQMTSHQRG